MAWITPHTWVTGDFVTSADFDDVRDELLYLKGAEAAQVEIELDCDMSTAVGLGVPSTETYAYLNKFYTSATPGEFTFLAQHATTVNDPDFCALIFGFREPAGAIELYSRIRARYGGAVGKGDLSFEARTGAAWDTYPAMTCAIRRVALGMSAANYTLDVDGDCNATGYEGLAIWNQSPVGTASHSGNAIVTSQWLSTLATGTAPIVGQAGAPMCPNLNADNLSGTTWASASLSDTGTDTIATANTPYTLCTVTTTRAGLHLIMGEASIIVHASDVGTTYAAVLTNGIGGEVFSGVAPTAKAKTSGDQVTLSTVALYVATASESLNFEVSKNSKAGSSTVGGSMVAIWLGV